MMLLCFRTRRGAPADHHFDSHRTTAGIAAAAPRSELNELNGRRGRSELFCAMDTTRALYAELKSASQSLICGRGIQLSALIARGLVGAVFMPSSDGSFVRWRQRILMVDGSILAYSARCARHCAARSMPLPRCGARSRRGWPDSRRMPVCQQKKRDVDMVTVWVKVVGWRRTRYHRPCIELLSRMVCGRMRGSTV